MKYIRKQIVVKVLADETIEDISVIKEIFQTFHKARTDAAISYRSSPMECLTSHQRVRIIKIEEETFDIMVINQSDSMTIRKIPYQFVEYVCTTVSPSEVYTKQDSVRKGDTLDLT